MNFDLIVKVVKSKASFDIGMSRSIWPEANLYSSGDFNARTEKERKKASFFRFIDH